MRSLLAAKAAVVAAAGAAVIFNRGNAVVGLVAATAAALLVFGIEAFANRQSALLLALNTVGAVLTLATLSLTKAPADARFFFVVVIFAFVQLFAELVINSQNGWFKKANVDHLINLALHLTIWSVFVWLSPDNIGALGAFGTYCGLLAVHWGIEAAGPKREA